MKKILLLLLGLNSLISFGQATFTNNSGTWGYSQDFNLLTGTTSSAWANNSTLTGWYVEKNSAGAISTYGPNTGSTTTAGLYSYGSASAADRAIGSAISNAFAGNPGGVAYGLRIQNNTGNTIYSLKVSYNGEQWRRDNTAAQKLTFAYKTGTGLSTVGATDLTTGGYTAVTTLDFTSPQLGSGVALDGNAVANRSVFTNIIINLATPILANEEVLLKWYDVNDSGNDHALAIDDVVITAGLTPIPQITTSLTSLTNINYLVNNGPSGAASFSISGINLSPATDNITVTPPANFEIASSLNGTYSDVIPITIPYTGGALTSTPIYVRLKAGLSAGDYGGATTYVMSSGGGATTVNVSVSGSVKTGTECGTAQNISTIRSTIPAQATYTGATASSIDGTVTGIFGANKFYVSDNTGGIAIFTNNIVTNNSLAVGDRVRLTGTPTRFNGEAEIATVTCIAKISSGTAPLPKVFDANNPPPGVALNDFLAANEGDLIKVISNNLNASGTFTTSVNYAIVACNNAGSSEIRIDATATTFSGYAIPTVTQDITGVLGHFITADAGTDKLQIYPRTPSDLTNSATTCSLLSGGGNGCGLPIVTDNPQTLDILIWNLEWFGSPNNGPTQSGTNDVTQINNAKTVLNSVGADVYILEEICGYNNANPLDVTTPFGKLVAGLNSTFGTGTYTGECSTDTSRSQPDAFAQHVCIIYKNSVVSKISSRPMFHNFTPLTYPPTGSPSNFWASGRNPFVFKAQVTLNGKVDTINFVGLHSKSGSDVTSYTRRAYDVKALYDSLQAYYSTQKVIIGGDLNDDVDVSIYPNHISSYSPFLYANPNETDINGVRPNADFEAVTKVLSDAHCASTASFPDDIDHFIISNELKSNSSKFNFLNGSVSNIKPYSLITNYSTTTSDHFPIFIRFRSQPCPIKPVISATSTNICGSGSVILSVSSCDGGTVKWTGGLTGSSITVSPTTNTNYKVACTIVDCTSDSSDVVTITVNPIPTKPTITPNSVLSCGGGSVTLISSACPNGTLNWTGGLTGSAITVSPTATKEYRVACILNGCTSDSSNAATITVKPKPNKPVVSPSSPSICMGSSISLTSTACTGGILYWTDGLYGTSVTVSPTSTKNYRVACMISGCISDSSDIVTVIVNPIPSPPTLNANPSTIILGSSSTLTATGCTGGIITWSFGGSTDNPLVVTPTSNTSYTATCTQNGCISPVSESVTVTVNSGEPCQNLLNLVSTADDYSAGVQLKQASSNSGKISASNKISGTAIATYQATSVELNPGFKADSGTVFKAEVGGCN